MKRRKLFSSIAFVLSLVMLAVSGAVFVHTATQQSATSSLQVTYDGRNVNFSADAWYQKPSNNARQAFTGNTLSVSATAAESSSHTLSVGSEITLDATTDTYILFTYKFVNTASSDGYDMLVALTDNATKTNVKVKYYTSVISGTNPSMYSTLSSQKDTVGNNGISLVPAPISVPAQYSLLYYILVEIDDYTMGATYTGDNDHKITWTITSASTKGASTPAVTYDANGGVEQNNSTPTKEGYTFGGWNTSSDGTGTTYTNEQALALAQAGGQPIMLYAKWEAEVTGYKVTIKVSNIYSGGYCETFQLWDNDVEMIDSVPTYNFTGNCLGDYTAAMKAVNPGGSMEDIEVTTSTGKVIVLMRSNGAFGAGDCDYTGGSINNINTHFILYDVYYTSIVFTINESSPHEIILSYIDWDD